MSAYNSSRIADIEDQGSPKCSPSACARCTSKSSCRSTSNTPPSPALFSSPPESLPLRGPLGAFADPKVGPGASDKVYDVIVIGAGVIGCSIARELSKYKQSILVLEKADDVAAGASKANSGIVHGGYDEEHGTLKSKVAHKGNQMFAKLNEELNFGFRVTGSMVLAFSEEERPLLLKLLENGVKNGVQDLRIIERDEIRRREPHISPDVHAALLCPHTGITSPYEYTIALAENAVVNGVVFKLRHEVTDIQRIGEPGSEGGAFVVRAGLNEIIRCRYI
ncbi:hypothetical protein HDV05_000785, partial [Chytridiales sp. JEL 0842]